MQLIFKSISALFALTCTVSLALACTPTGFVRDTINLTAALINPGNVSGDVDGTGCNIVVYYGPGTNGQVSGASIHSSNYYGIVNNGANVAVQNSTVYDIGETPLNGDQHGVGIYFAYQSNARGNITGNTIWNYQKGGIVVNGPLAQSNIQNNNVIGQGPVNYIAQNGIQLGYGARGNIQGNLVVGNSYTGANDASSGGIILVGGDCYGGPTVAGSNVQQNIGVGNDVGIWFSNLDASCNPVLTPTNDTAQNNTLRNNAVNNTTGNFPGPPGGYQAGISDQGDGDKIQGNSICGTGYTPVAIPPPYLFFIDNTATNNPTVQNNVTCSASGPETSLNDPVSAVNATAAAHGTIVPQVVQ